ncbi:MAG: hypothetical protein IJD39_03650 [Clostridia bacterium]|nr:hypothetical protein [Clostridia bacterium]
MKRWIACILALMLSFSCTAMAETAAGSFDPAKAEMLNDFEHTWFLSDAHEYQHPLCLASIQLAQAAFRGDDAAPDASIRQYLKSHGFSQPRIDEYALKTADTIGTAIAHRTVGEGNQERTLVVIAVCGGNYSMEWLSNFDVGLESVHKGFGDSARKIVSRVQEYLSAHQIHDPLFWITGYSRAAAVSNLTAAFLSQEGIADDASIFCYTFATPRTVIGSDAANAHQNIFNIVNNADLVPHVPLAAWGYGWYGRTLYLPSSLTETLDYAAMLPAFESAYSYLAGDNPLPGIDASLIEANFLPGGDASFADKAVMCARGMALSAGTPKKYADHYQAILNKVFTGEEMQKAEQLLMVTMLMNAANTALKKEGVVISVTSDLENALAALSPLVPVLMQHMPQIYTGWLLSIDDASILTDHLPALTK